LALTSRAFFNVVILFLEYFRLDTTRLAAYRSRPWLTSPKTNSKVVALDQPTGMSTRHALQARQNTDDLPERQIAAPYRRAPHGNNLPVLDAPSTSAHHHGRRFRDLHGGRDSGVLRIAP